MLLEKRKILKIVKNLAKRLLGEGNLIFCCKDSRENYSRRLVGKTIIIIIIIIIILIIIIIIILSFRLGTFKNNIDHRGKETRAIFGLPIHNKNSAINGLLPFFLFTFLF